MACLSFYPLLFYFPGFQAILFVLFVLVISFTVLVVLLVVNEVRLKYYDFILYWIYVLCYYLIFSVNVQLFISKLIPQNFFRDLIIYYFCVESSVPVKGENIDIVDESKTLDVMPVNHRREKPRTLGAKVKGNNSVPGVNIPPLKASKLEKFSALDISSFPEIKEGPQPSITGSRKRKQKSFGFKVRST